MIRYALLILLSLGSVFAAEIKSYNVYERDSRIDLMLTFDAPFSGEISQTQSANKVTLSLTQLSYAKQTQETLESSMLKEFYIIPTSSSSVKVELITLMELSITASKTIDGYGLRIRAKPIQNTPQAKAQSTTLADIGANAGFEIDTNYYIVIAVLLILLIVLLFIKRSLNNTQAVNKKSWLFQNNSDDAVKILYRKPIDAQNSVALIEFYDTGYLVLTGSSNVVLDRFVDKKVKSQDDFQEVFEQNRKKLENYLERDGNKLKSYKDKVSQLQN